MQILLTVDLTRTEGPAYDDVDQLADELVEVIESHNVSGKLHVGGDDDTEGTTYDLSATYEVTDETDDDPAPTEVQA